MEQTQSTIKLKQPSKMNFRLTFVIIFFSIGILPLLAIPLTQNKVDPKALSKAIRSNDIGFLEEYLTDEIINDCYDIGTTKYNALAMSIKLGAEESFEYIASRADLDRTCGGKTALMYAAKYGRVDMTKKLIVLGVNVKADSNGRTAIDYAKKYKQSEILAILRNI